MTSSRKNTAATQAFSLAGYFLFVIVLFVLLRQQISLLGYFEFGDESETIITTRMMAAGMRLYSDIFNQHGPLIFLPGWLLEQFGHFNIAAHRIPILLLQWVALYSLASSPVIGERLHNLRIALMVVTGLAFVLFMPKVFGQMMIYQTVAGLLIMITLAQYTIPALLIPQKLTQRAIFSGNFLLALLPFLAITYLPASILLALAASRTKYWRIALAGWAAGLIACLAYTALIASFPGYLAYHFHLNAEIMPQFNQTGGLARYWSNAQQAITGKISFYLPLAILATIVLGGLWHAHRNRKSLELLGIGAWRVLLFVPIFFSFLIRGGEFHALPFFYGACALPLFFMPLAEKARFFAIDRFVDLRWAATWCLLAIVSAYILHAGITKQADSLQARKIEMASQFGSLAKTLTQADERILSYSFQNFHYLTAERLPASGAFFFLPWQAVYNRAPYWNIAQDPCLDIRRNKPKLVYVDRWQVWGVYDWASYGACIEQALADEYLLLADTGILPAGENQGIYLRRDFYDPAQGVALAPEKWTMSASPPLSIQNPLALTMSASHLARRMPIQRIGIRLGTYGHMPTGNAELRLYGPNGVNFSAHFSLANVADNRYRFFDIDTGIYERGEIRLLPEDKTGNEAKNNNHGIAVLEARRLDQSNSNQAGLPERRIDREEASCLIYEYIDGLKSFTPGCWFY